MKKDKFRFTIRFCKVSPKHITAMEVLNAAGRQKASLIADLIDEHIKKRGADAFTRYFCETAPIPTQFANDDAEAIAEAEMGSSKALKSSVAKVSAAAEVLADFSADLNEDEPMSDEMQNSILEALDMFKMQT